MARAGIENEAREPMGRALGYSLRQAACPKLRFAHSLTPTKHNYYVRVGIRGPPLPLPFFLPHQFPSSITLRPLTLPSRFV